MTWKPNPTGGKYTCMDYVTLQAERHGGAFVVTFQRPETKNAFNAQMKEEVIAATREAEADPDVRALVFTGGPQYFSSGQDLNEALAVKTPSEIMAMLGSWHRVTAALEASPKPVIAAIEGFCITGGLEFALACDLRIAAEGASFGITSARIGTVAGAGGTVRLPRLVGEAKALELLFGADPIDAAEALRIGLVNQLVPKGESLARATQIVEGYGQRGPLSLALAKRAVRQGMQMDVRSALEFETFLVSTIYGTADREEGITAFLEKRPPRFQGK